MRRWNLNALWLFRIPQGFGGGMVPVAQSILFVPTGEARPSFCAVRRRRGSAGGGPALGGWLSSWEWCFLINVPVGVVAMP